MAAKTRVQKATELVNLAGTYLEDGAPFTAAARLEEAAKLLRRYGEERNRALARIDREDRRINPPV